ncbi:hypothetical protein EHLJMEHL_04917 [Vreelandella titanicae]
MLSREDFLMIKQLHQRGAHLVDIAHQIGCCERTVRRLATRYERRTEIHYVFTLLGCSLICFKRLTRQF